MQQLCGHGQIESQSKGRIFGFLRMNDALLFRQWNADCRTQCFEDVANVATLTVDL